MEGVPTAYPPRIPRASASSSIPVWLIAFLSPPAIIDMKFAPPVPSLSAVAAYPPRLLPNRLATNTGDNHPQKHQTHDDNTGSEDNFQGSLLYYIRI